MDLELTPVRLGEENLAAFAPLLPQTLVPALAAGKIAGLGILLLDTPCAAAAVTAEGYGARLLSLYVDPYFRRMGIGSLLLEQVESLLRQTGGLFSLQCVPPRTPEVLGFLTAQEFSFSENEAQSLSFSLRELSGSPLFPEKGIRVLGEGRCVSGEEMAEEAVADFFRQLAAQGELLTARSWSDPAVLRGATQFFVSGGRIAGCLLLCRGEADSVVLEFAYVSQQGRAFQAMLSCGTEYLRAHYPPDTLVTLEAVNETARRLAAKLIPNAAKNRQLLAKKLI